MAVKAKFLRFYHKKGEGEKAKWGRGNTVFGFPFSVKRNCIINKLAIEFVASETELGIKRLKGRKGE